MSILVATAIGNHTSICVCFMCCLTAAAAGALGLTQHEHFLAVVALQGYWINQQEMAMKSEISISMAEKLAQELRDDEFKNYVGQILESKYDKVSPAEVAEAQKHLTSEQRKGIESLVSK
jgi:hypothetical protein